MRQPEYLDEWVPQGAIARAFNVSHTTAARWRKQGLLPEPRRINNRNYYRRADVERLTNTGAGK